MHGQLLSDAKAPLCRQCGKPLRLLDEKGERWYCYRDDELFYGKTQSWSEPLAYRTSEYVHGDLRIQRVGKVIVGIACAIFILSGYLNHNILSNSPLWVGWLVFFVGWVVTIFGFEQEKRTRIPIGSKKTVQMDNHKTLSS